MDWMSDWLRSIEVEESGEPGTLASHVAEPTSASLLHSR
jgi:hypothetical protein